VAKTLSAWLEEDVAQVKDEPLSWLSQRYFFRDPSRPAYADPSYFFSPADGIILYQRVVKPDEPVLDIKGRPYSLRSAMRDPAYDRTSLVVGIFMTFYDVHVNRLPYTGRLSYQLLGCIDTINHPMLEVEKAILAQLRLPPVEVEYLHHNQRVLNRVDSPYLDDPYYVLQIADYDVDCITPFELRQNQPNQQGGRFSQIRYGSQVDLIVPLSEAYELDCIHDDGTHVEAGVDPIINIRFGGDTEREFP
jgi:phosphatidylserine decarboxylase